tara:strand:+ start:718 stop:1740 length:1023 start_codon:yes stop_codon:yes gene_type:complete
MECQLDYWKGKKINKELMETLFIYSPFRMHKFVIKGETITPTYHWHSKRQRAYTILNFLKLIVKKYNNLNCTIYIRDGDFTFEKVVKDDIIRNLDIIYNDSPVSNEHIRRIKELTERKWDPLNIKKLRELSKIIDMKNMSKYYTIDNPFFCIYKDIMSNNICIPDHFFMQNYKKYNRVNNSVSYYQQVMSSNKKIKLKDKKNKAVFSGRDKYKKYNGLNRYEYVTTNPKRNMNQQLQYKFLIGTYSRWDTIYWQLLSNSVTLIEENPREILFYYYYLKPNIHYIPYNENNINNCVCNNDEVFLDKISKESTNLMESLTFEKMIDEFGKLLLIYNEIYNSQ